MAKTPVKKSRRRLKRSVRRSLAAVFMITAIGVAAIPVPENLAEAGVPASANPAVKPYQPADKDSSAGEDCYEDFGNDTSNEKVKIENDKVNVDGGWADIIKAPDSKYHSTEIVIEDNGNTYLTWQFVYEELTNTTGKLCGYNSTYHMDSVTLGLQPIERYYMVTADDFNAYYTSPGTIADETIKNDMENINSDGNAVTGKVHPVNEIEYKYENYDPVTDGVIDLSQAEKKFLEDYYLAEFQQYTNRFRDYYEKVQAGEDAGEKPSSLKVSPAQMSTENKIKFFCENNAVLRDTGYSLKQAFDQRLDGKGDTVYLAHGGNPEMLGNNVTGKTYTDYNGYVASYDKHSIPVIGDNAFFGANNVGQIVISDQVRAIGDSAFELSGISSLTIGNAETIGNRAFARCHTLKEVQFSNPGTKIIGAEAFWDSGINSKLSLPYTITTIGYGAFAECLDLSEVEFDQANSSQDLVLKDYAFFNDKALTKVDFGKIGVDSMGYACFAVESPGNDAMTEFSFPTVKLGKLTEKEITVGSEPLDPKTYKRSHTLANRRNLNTVNIPKGNIRIPDGTFYNCFGLEKVAFDADSADATFGPDLFADVTNPDFCVYGPETSNGRDPAEPRKRTWDATRNDGKSIPYVYESGGKTYYEVAIESENGSRYRYGAGNDGELISCALIEKKGSGLVDIVIPEKIGNFAIKRIGEDCFSDKELREVIGTITIQDNSISEIAGGAFAELPKLTTVSIGNSVASIGDRAFYGCKQLEDVYFKKPSAGYESVTFGTDAFVTTGKKLTFHGDIIKGYAPFDYAVNKDNVLKDPESVNVPAVNICYQSLWDSENGRHLTVMPDKDGVVTLLDYPKFSDLNEENIARDDELQKYCKDMEDYYYYTVYDSGGNVEQMRKEYALIWNAQRNGEGSVTLEDGTMISSDGYENALNERYGPWINPNYCATNDGEAGYWTSYLSAEASGDSGLADLLFKPLAVYAAGENPTPYFEKYPYNFMENYQNWLEDRESYEASPDYKRLTDKEWNYINAPQSLIVPDGVDSIDVSSYYQECGTNYDTYIRLDIAPESNTMYTSVTKDATPGLFSGYYEDYEAPDEREEEKRGNDYIKSIVLTSVKTLPDYAFDSCEQLDSVELGAVEEVGDLPFRGCPNLIHLTGSERYPALNGILYEKNEGTPETYDIVECLMSRGRSDVGEETIARGAIGPDPDTLISSVVEIRDGAFADCGDISIVDLGTAEGLAIIPEDCFEGCTNLRQVILPRTVTQIKEGAFGDVTENNNKLDVTIPGREVDIADSAFQPKSGVTIYTYEDSAAYRYGKRYEKEGMVVNLLTAYRVMFYDYDGTLVGEPQVVDKTKSPYATEPPEAETLKEPNHRPGYTFSGWETTGGKTLTDEITEDMTIFVAQYTSDGTMVNGKYAIEFIDGIDGRQLSGRNANADDGKYYIEPGASFADMGWNLSDEFTIPVHDGYAFKAWSDGWTENTLINSDTHKTVIALYSAQPTSGNSTNTSRNSGNTSNNSGNNNNNNNNNNNSSSNSSTSSSSTSTSSTTSGSGSTVGRYTVTVQNGSGSGTYEVGSTVVISANEPAAGMTFQKWTTESNGVTLASVSLPATTFTMPANNVTVTANFVAAATTASANSSGDGSGSNSGSGSTRVDITKPGISNKDLAAANVNGSTDNFVVKITETDEATRAVAAALTNKYGSLDNILYYAMDISLYDSTGTTKITDVSGLSVDITIPIPDALVAYGGNNMAGAVINGDQLENLNENFTTINGVPCIRFTATHFSPYTVYVDTGNLTEGMLDTTPKTGDPIHPKWFLSLGLACLSVILFMKKDKGPKVKTA